MRKRLFAFFERQLEKKKYEVYKLRWKKVKLEQIKNRIINN